MPKNQPSRYPLIENTALPYIKGITPIWRDQPHLVDGNNVMTSWKGYLQRRPGTSTYTTDDYSANTIRRFFYWQQWDGSRYIMANEVRATASVVYKLKIGTDTTFQGIHTSTSNEPFDFVVTNNSIYFGNGTDMKKWEPGVSTYDWGVDAPSTAATVTPDAGGSGVTLAIGRRYVYAFGRAANGYLSDISPVSASTGVVSTDSEIDLTGDDIDNDYIDEIHIYGTEDGGFVFRELSTSPIVNPNDGLGWTHSDTDADTDLLTTKAPKAGVNAKFRDSKGFAFFAGRIWGFSGSKVYYTGLEEVSNGLAPEASDTNNEYDFGREVTGLAAVNNILLVFTLQGLFTIQGDSLSTFKRGTLSMSHGARNRAAIAADASGVFWLDISNSVFVTNGLEITEIGRFIREDIKSIDHSEASMTIHRDGTVNWALLCDGNAGKIRTLDLDLEQWMPPWTLSGAETIKSVETANGTWTLLLGQSGKPIQFDHTLNQDQGASYAAYATTGLIPTTVDLPEEVANIEQVSIERNSVAPSTVQYLADDDPSTGTYTTISTTADPPYHTSGTDIVEKWYWVHQLVSRRLSIKINWAAANSNFRWYSLYVKAKRFGRQ